MVARFLSNPMIPNNKCPTDGREGDLDLAAVQIQALGLVISKIMSECFVPKVSVQLHSIALVLKVMTWAPLRALNKIYHIPAQAL